MTSLQIPPLLGEMEGASPKLKNFPLGRICNQTALNMSICNAKDYL